MAHHKHFRNEIQRFKHSILPFQSNLCALWNQRYHFFVSHDAVNSHSAAHANNFLYQSLACELLINKWRIINTFVTKFNV